MILFGDFNLLREGKDEYFYRLLFYMIELGKYFYIIDFIHIKLYIF